jgi:predicted PhzF superfamily epimerase YddE/YHI9
MDFPAERATALPVNDEIRAIVGGEPLWFGKNRMDYIVEVADETAVRELDPDMTLVKKLGLRGLIVTAAASSTSDYVSRFFAPQCGVDEDPVTGSAHCCLGPYWAEKLGRPSLTGYQASRRGGYVGTTVKGERVILRGQAVTTFALTIVSAN